MFFYLPVSPGVDAETDTNTNMYCGGRLSNGGLSACESGGIDLPYLVEALKAMLVVKL